MIQYETNGERASYQKNEYSTRYRFQPWFHATVAGLSVWNLAYSIGMASLPQTPFFSIATRYRYPSLRSPGPTVFLNSSHALYIPAYILLRSCSIARFWLRRKSCQARCIVQWRRWRCRAMRRGGGAGENMFFRSVLMRLKFSDLTAVLFFRPSLPPITGTWRARLASVVENARDALAGTLVAVWTDRWPNSLEIVWENMIADILNRIAVSIWAARSRGWPWNMVCLCWFSLLSKLRSTRHHQEVFLWTVIASGSVFQFPNPSPNLQLTRRPWSSALGTARVETRATFDGCWKGTGRYEPQHWALRYSLIRRWCHYRPKVPQYKFQSLRYCNWNYRHSSRGAKNIRPIGKRCGYPRNNDC